MRPDMEKYERVSGRLMAILTDFSDLVEQVSIDEAFLDVTGSRRLFGSGVEIAHAIKNHIFIALNLTASVGVAGNKFIAKVASDLKKPDGLVVVKPGTEMEFLSPLPVGRLWGVGAKTESFLLEQGIRRIGQLLECDLNSLEARLGKVAGQLRNLAAGKDERPVIPEEGYKSIGHEHTFEKDTTDTRLLHDTLLELTERVAQRLRAHGARARTITVKFREADFSTFTRRTMMSNAVDTLEKIWPAAQKLMNSLIRETVPVRLIGVYASNLVVEAGEQLSLFDQGKGRDRKLAAAMDDITRRYGNRAIRRASLVGPSQKSNQGD